MRGNEVRRWNERRKLYKSLTALAHTQSLTHTTAAAAVVAGQSWSTLSDKSATNSAPVVDKTVGAAVGETLRTTVAAAVHHKHPSS